MKRESLPGKNLGDLSGLPAGITLNNVPWEVLKKYASSKPLLRPKPRIKRRKKK